MYFAKTKGFAHSLLMIITAISVVRAEGSVQSGSSKNNLRSSFISSEMYYTLISLLS
jgi:hypothetical protein